MTAHLKSRQISEAVLGILPGRFAVHLEECDFCQSHVSRLKKDLALFGYGVRNWSESQVHEVPVLAIGTPRFRFSFPQFAIVGVVTTIFLGVLILCEQPQLQRTEKPVVAVTDAALLQQVDAELAETIPGPMQPLMKLVAIDQRTKSGGTVDSVKSRNE